MYTVPLKMHNFTNETTRAISTNTMKNPNKNFATKTKSWYETEGEKRGTPVTNRCREGRRKGALEQFKALVWFWIIDETLVLTSILNLCRLNEVGTCQVMEQVMIMVIIVITTR